MPELKTRLEGAGFLSPDGGVTPLGEQWIATTEGEDHPDKLLDLYERGLIDATGSPTDDGRLFAMDERQVVMEEGRDAYKRWQRIGGEEAWKKETGQHTDAEWLEWIGEQLGKAPGFFGDLLGMVKDAGGASKELSETVYTKAAEKMLGPKAGE